MRKREGRVTGRLVVLYVSLTSEHPTPSVILDSQEPRAKCPGT